MQLIGTKHSNQYTLYASPMPDPDNAHITVQEHLCIYHAVIIFINTSSMKLLSMYELKTDTLGSFRCPLKCTLPTAQRRAAQLQAQCPGS